MWGSNFSILGVELDTYKAFIYLAFLCAGALFYVECKRRDISYADFLLLFIVCLVFGPIGGLGMSILEFGRPLSSAIEGTAGASHLGGYLLVLPLLVLVTAFRKINTLQVLDSACLAWLVGCAIGRLGCFFSGDGCYGIETSSFLGMTFPKAIFPAFQPVYPTPLFEFFYSLLIFTIFYFRYRRQVVQGRIFFGASSWMFFCRFGIEFIRRNPKYSGLTLAQWSCIPLTLLFSGSNMFLPELSFRFKKLTSRPGAKNVDAPSMLSA